MQVEHIQVSAEDTKACAAGRSVDAALDTLVDAIRENCEVDSLLHPALDIIERYDRENQTDLLRTLKVYLENDCNAQKCGRLLFLHRNSLVYRVHRIQEISGCDLSNPTERSYLRVSFLLRH